MNQTEAKTKLFISFRFKFILCPLITNAWARQSETDVCPEFGSLEKSCVQQAWYAMELHYVLFIQYVNWCCECETIPSLLSFSFSSWTLIDASL